MRRSTILQKNYMNTPIYTGINSEDRVINIYQESRIMAEGTLF